MDHFVPENVYQEVKATYLKQVEIPDTKLSPQFVLCPIGLIGSGKTTVLMTLTARMSLVRVSGDELRKLFKNRGHGYSRVRELGFEIVRGLLQRGYRVAIDSDCSSAESQEQVKLIWSELKVRVVWIHVNPPESFIITKLSNLIPNWLGTAQEMINSYCICKSLHRHLHFDFTYVFDTSKPNLSQQIEEAELAINQAIKHPPKDTWVDQVRPRHPEANPDI